MPFRPNLTISTVQEEDSTYYEKTLPTELENLLAYATNYDTMSDGEFSASSYGKTLTYDSDEGYTEGEDSQDSQDSQDSKEYTPITKVKQQFVLNTRRHTGLPVTLKYFKNPSLNTFTKLFIYPKESDKSNDILKKILSEVFFS